MEPTEADNEIEEEHLLNFVVNSLDEELEIDIDENVKVTTETLYEVLAGASAGGASINHVCETTEGSPHANTVRGHLTEQFELDSVEAVGDTLLQRDALETLPDRPVEACADLHLDPYYGDEDETEALYSSQAKRGTTTFHAYATLYARVRNKRYTLAVRQLVAGDTTSDVLGEFLELLDGLDLGVKAVYLDRGFYNGTCLGLLSTHNYAYMMPIVKWSETIQDELSRGWSREIEHELAGKVTFPVFIDCVYQQGRYDEHGVARHGYAADAPFIDTSRDAREHYSERFGIESNYRLAKQSLAFTSSQDAGLRLVMFVVSLLLQNSWRYLHWRYVAAPPAAGRRLWQWSFTEFCEMTLRAAWTALGVRRTVPANQPLDDRFFR
ncbi:MULTISPECIES: ISH3 family transposase [unclassified Halorubrum]|uniref:ISH3 family transposase n=1 Tax=unclassified Halorubrum TaxID=2642239 RepID=UPI0010F5207A|nr:MULTISPECIES: ISH3 family transposase [unclassified Halorubrum]TKX40249.1 ISH3 family transposase [Halorubrum sp. CGM4_25_10-8A]TKX65923.1 ISH3 family transposase [Halorubrum sp. GN12_10-3_MGM]